MSVVPGFGDIGSGGFFDTPAQRAARAAWMAESTRQLKEHAKTQQPWNEQMPNEPSAVFGLRKVLGSILTPFETVIEGTPKALLAGSKAVRADVGQAFREAIDTPAKAQARARAAAPKPSPASVFPNSYTDPAYDAAEQYASQITGVPVELLRRIRTQGERSNNNQVSSKGGRSPYQIIPETAAGIQRNYGIDPFASPKNAALAAAYVLREQAGGRGANAPNWQDPAVLARAAGGYFGGAAGARNPFGTLSDGGTTVGGYTQRVLGPNTPLPFPAINPYNPAYDQAALGQLNVAQQAAMTPFSAGFNRGPAPEMPEPQPIPKTDFSQADADLEAMRPHAMAEEEKIRRERTGWFHGLAQAMMNMPEGAGMGKFFMALGGASLAGRMAAREDNQAAQDRFDQRMAQFNAAVYQHDLGKAQTIAKEAQAEVEQNNKFAVDKFNLAYKNWAGSTSMDIQGTNVVVHRLDPKTGQESISTLPIGPAVQSAFALQRAQQYSSMGGRQFGGNHLVASQTNALMANAAAAQMAAGSGDHEATDAAATAAPAFYATHVARFGLAPQLLGEERYKALDAEVTQRLKSAGELPGSTTFPEAKQRMIAEALTQRAIIDPAFLKQMSEVGKAADFFESTERVYGGRESTRTDYRGRTTTSRSSQGSYEPIGAQ